MFDSPYGEWKSIGAQFRAFFDFTAAPDEPSMTRLQPTSGPAKL